MLGFTTVYREGFETVLFLQAIVLEAGVRPRRRGRRARRSSASPCVGVLTIVLQRKLPHKRMLELTGAAHPGVLVIMVGKTVQVCQVVGWLPVHPIDGAPASVLGRAPGSASSRPGRASPRRLGALLFVLGSYLGAERLRAQLRRRKRQRILAAPLPEPRLEPASEPEKEPVPAGLESAW